MPMQISAKFTKGLEALIGPGPAKLVNKYIRKERDELLPSKSGQGTLPKKPRKKTT